MSRELVKAYTEATKTAIEYLPVEELIPKIHFQLDLTYGMYDQVSKMLRLHSAEIEERVFEMKIHISGSIPEKNLSVADKSIQDVSAGRVKLVIGKLKMNNENFRMSISAMQSF